MSRTVRVIAGVLLAACACTSSTVTLEIIPVGDQEAHVGQTFVLEIGVRNPAHAQLSFSFDAPELPDSGAAIYPMNDVGVFRWTPLASHAADPDGYSFTFGVSGGGASDSETIVITVVASDSGPVFIQPGAGGTYDLSRDPCVAVHVEVKDDDSLPSQIGIDERAPRIEGAEMTAAGKQADWRWCPSQPQVEATDRYTLGLLAQDESHPAVEHDYVIVLRGVGRDDCPGASPQIAASSPPPPDVLATSLDYRVDARVTDDQGLKDLPILYYTTDRPADTMRPDVTTFRQVMFAADGGDDYHALIPNLGLAGDARATVYYVISATDNDDAQGSACDHRTDSPLRQFDAAPGTGETSAYCEPCSTDAQCASGACVAAVVPFCAGACASCPAGAECRDATTVGGHVARACVPLDLDCAPSVECTDDGHEDNDSWGTARGISTGLYTDLVVCPGDGDFYSISAASSGTLDVLVDGWNADTTDIDLQLLRSDGTSLRTSAGISDSEEITTCVDRGTYGVRVWGFLTDSGPYSLLVDLTPGSCCSDDGMEDNDSFRTATPVAAPGTLTDGQICAGDDDWFEVAASSGQRLSADLEIDGGDLDLELYDTDGMRRLASSAGTGASEHVEADVSASGAYYLRVFGYRGAEGSYLLEHQVSAGSGCSSSLSCPSGTVCNGSACVDDACTPGSSTCPSGTFCPETGGAGGSSDCADPCDSASDCRSGYACKVFAVASGCAQAGSGLAGDPCTSFRACAADRICMAWPGGYCARAGCTANADCGTGSYCVRLGGAGLGTCVKDCLWSDDLCRLSESYRCACSRDAAAGMQWVCLPPGESGPTC